jgi:hypothetical protein
MIGVREMTTRTAKTPSKMIPTTLPDIEASVLALIVRGQA